MYPYAIGDIHGDLMKLRVLLSHLESIVRPQDAVVFLGDYIDRGCDSRGCVDAILKFRAEHDRTICLRGNHEHFLLESLKTPLDYEEMELWLMNGGWDTLDSYGIRGEYGSLPSGELRKRPPEEHVAFYESTLMEYETRTHMFVHAGLPPPSYINQDARRDPRLWIREAFIDNDFDFGKIVVFGHTPRSKTHPILLPGRIGIDTGAAYGGRLSMIRIGRKVRSDSGVPRFELYQVAEDGELTVTKAA